MPKIGYIIISIAVITTVGLFFLPRVVVENEPGQTASVGTIETGGGVATDSHSGEIPEDIVESLSLHKTELADAKSESEKLLILKELMGTYQSVNFYDSAAYFAGSFVADFPSLANYKMAGDAFYEAFSFAMTPEKTNQLAEKARFYYGKVLNIDPNQEDIKVKVGVTYVSGENPMQGILQIRQVLEQNPNNTLAVYNLGLLSMQSGQFDKAVARFEKLIELEPKNTQAHYYLGVCLLETDRKQKALERFEYVKANETNPQVLQAVDAYLEEIKQQ